MTRYDIYMEKLRDNGQDIKKTASEDIYKNIVDIKRISESIKWEGPSYDQFKKQFNQKMQSIEYIPFVIEAYGNFMIKASGGFDEINDQMYNDLLIEMEKNDKKKIGGEYDGL